MECVNVLFSDQESVQEISKEIKKTIATILIERLLLNEKKCESCSLPKFRSALIFNIHIGSLNASKDLIIKNSSDFQKCVHFVLLGSQNTRMAGIVESQFLGMRQGFSQVNLIC